MVSETDSIQAQRPVRRMMCEDDTPHMVRNMYRSNLVDAVVRRTPLPDVSQHLTGEGMAAPDHVSGAAII